MKVRTLSLLILGALMGQFALAQSTADEYPLTLNGKRRVVIEMPREKDEQSLSIQWRLAKLIPNSDCNGKVVIPKMESKKLSGSDLPYIEILEVDILSTMMGCGNQPRKPQTVFSGSFAANYTRESAPLVIYVEAGIDVQARVSKAVGPFDLVKGN